MTELVLTKINFLAISNVPVRAPRGDEMNAMLYVEITKPYIMLRLSIQSKRKLLICLFSSIFTVCSKLELARRYFCLNKMEEKDTHKKLFRSIVKYF